MRIICIYIRNKYNAQQVFNTTNQNLLFLERNVIYRSIAKNVLFSAITFSLAQPALAVTDEEFNALKEQFNQLADQVDENSQNSSSATTVGGYGELHYNNLSDGAGNDKKVLDLHRFVIFVNHEFNDDIRFFSEFEILLRDIIEASGGAEERMTACFEEYLAHILFSIPAPPRGFIKILYPLMS